MFITKELIVKVETPGLTSRDTRDKQKPVLLESVDSNLSDGALVQFAHKTNDAEKLVKYFL